MMDGSPKTKYVAMKALPAAPVRTDTACSAYITCVYETWRGSTATVVAVLEKVSMPPKIPPPPGSADDFRPCMLPQQGCSGRPAMRRHVLIRVWAIALIAGSGVTPAHHSQGMF